MCVGENNAPQAVHYINSQLSALYDNALSCIRDHNNAQRHEETYRYAHALAGFDYGRFRAGELINQEEMMFHVEFGKPYLEFICNHDLILHLKIKKGRYYPDHSKVIYVTDKQRVQYLNDVDVAFRIPFDSRKLSGRDGKIGNGPNQIRFVIMELLKAQLQTLQPDAHNGKGSLMFYLTKYLELLQSAGNHVLFSLPDFDDDDLQVKINYSLMANRVQQHTDLFGIGIEKINAYLSSAWLKAAMLANQSANKTPHWQTYCLAEFKTAWIARRENSIHFHVKLGAPRIHAICSREAVLYFNVKDVSFYDGLLDTEEPRKYGKWTIALLVRLIPESEGGRVTRCRLDISSAEIHWKLCKFSGLSLHDAEAQELAEHFVEFFRLEYLEILESLEYHIVWKETENVFSFGSESDGELDGGSFYHNVGEEEVEGGATGVVVSRKVVTWKEIIANTVMHGFDHVIALSQASIDAHFAALWSAYAAKSGHYASILGKWQFGEYFSANLRPIMVRLLSNNRALVSFSLESGHSYVLKDHDYDESVSAEEKYNFENWRLSFEVGLKECRHEELELSEAWLSKFTETELWRQHGNLTDRYLKHIYLDFETAEFVHEFSRFDGLSHHEDDSPIEKVQAAVHYFQEHYFPQLTQSGLHLLYTIPVWTIRDHIPAHAMTAASFHVYSKLTVTRHNCVHIAPSLEPVLVVIGMTGHREFPASRLEFSSAWVARANSGVSYGTLAISKQIFMDRFLELFSEINRHTTIVPVFNGIESDKWQLQLTTWAKHQFRKQKKCEWKIRSERDGFVKYAWEHRDVWRYEHEGSAGDIVNGVYSVTSVTKNYMELPTAFRNRSLEIKVWGESQLELSFDSSKNVKGWSTKSSARWDASLDIVTEHGGLKVQVQGSQIPQVEMAKVEGDAAASVFSFCENPEKLLRQHLPQEVDFGLMVHELKAFEGSWRTFYAGTTAFTLANPVFNQEGDLLFELSLQGHQTVPALAAISRPGTLGVGTPGSRPSTIGRSSSFFAKLKEAVFDEVTSLTGAGAAANRNGRIQEEIERRTTELSYEETHVEM
ncbi:hypothetical protein CERSUDRAFT_105605 [Gelatoporia subvermispora B]|uniref:Uncharacterized protein n=1 Tax=Ceriporiopsis subvermispora (strain B) TaxID=914234 RepID=M2PMP4_CERS8|nr:hypothetical protein CERSUDRAFT_105605 [Gelatoporia subvermispora B]